MNVTKLAICTVVSTVYIFLIDYLFYGILMVDYFEYCCEREMPDFPFLILGILIFSLFFCIIYAKGVERGSKTIQGFRFGVMVAFFVFVSMGFIYYSIMDSEQCGGLTHYLVDMVFRVVEIGILGVIIAHLSGIDTAEGRGEDQPPRPGPPDDKSGGQTTGGGN